MTYKVTFTYPNGETKTKCKGIKQLETALKVVEHYERFFARTTYTKTPNGVQFPSNEVSIDFDEE